MLVAVWDGEPARDQGGTAHNVRRARELGKPIIVVRAHNGATGATAITPAEQGLVLVERLPG